MIRLRSRASQLALHGRLDSLLASTAAASATSSTTPTASTVVATRSLRTSALRPTADVARELFYHRAQTHRHHQQQQARGLASSAGPSTSSASSKKSATPSSPAPAGASTVASTSSRNGAKAEKASTTVLNPVPRRSAQPSGSSSTPPPSHPSSSSSSPKSNSASGPSNASSTTPSFQAPRSELVEAAARVSQAVSGGKASPKSSSESSSSAAKDVTSGPSSSQGVASGDAKGGASGAASTAAPAERKTIKARLLGLWETMRFLFRFYFNGVKQIWFNRTRVKEILERERLGKEKERSLLESVEGKGKGKVDEAQLVVARAERNWEEAQLIRTHSADMKKLPLFLFILLILEELLPLMVIYMLTKIQASEELRRAKAVERLRASDDAPLVTALQDVRGLAKSSGSGQASLQLSLSLEQLKKDTLVDLAKLYSLTSWGPASLLRSRIASHLSYLQEDDELLRSAKNLVDVPQGAMSVAKACAHRGLRCSEVEVKEAYESLLQWLAISERSMAPPVVAAAAAATSNSSSTAEVMQPQSSSNWLAALSITLYRAVRLESLESKVAAEGSKGVAQQAKAVVESVVREEREAEERRKREEREKVERKAGSS